MPSNAPQHLREMVGKAVKQFKFHLKRDYHDQVSFEKGAVQLAQELLELSKRVGAFIKTTASVNTLKLPDTTVRQPELNRLISTLYDSLTRFDGNIRFIAPVCPDYTQESNESFYQTIGEGISPQAAAAIRAARSITEISTISGFSPLIDILVADTEDDIPEVMQRCVNGDSSEYQRRCKKSVAEIDEELSNDSNIVAATFTEGFGDNFRQLQYAYEGIISNLRLSTEKIESEVNKLGENRTQRHRKILGRNEQDYELTVRYMAQYAALGTLIRRFPEPTILLNYPTPNLPFFNAASYRSSYFSISESDKSIIPVLTTIL